MTAIQMAEFLFNRHSHSENGSIVYKEKDVIELLQALGHPAPDFSGWAESLPPFSKTAANE